MSDKKMIIRNCPAIYGIDDGFLCSDDNDESEKYCYDCTDCVLKQIVELYKEQTQFCKDCSTLTCEDCTFSTNGFAEEVIELLDIQEVE